MFASLMLFNACNTDDSVEESNVEIEIQERIEELISKLPPAHKYDFKKVELEIPPCRLIEERFTASYETDDTNHRYYYQNGVLSKVEHYVGGTLNNYKLYVHEGTNHVKVYSEDSVILDEYFYEDGLPIKRIFYDNGNVIAYGYSYYDNGLLNRSISAGINGEIFVLDYLSDKYGNIVESWGVWENDGPPSEEYRYFSKYDTNFFPYIGLPVEFENTDVWGPYNEIEVKVYIDGELRSDNEEISLEYYDNRLVKTRVEDSGTIHQFDYVYDCD